MTTVKEKFEELFGKHSNWCNVAKKLLKDESADMYNSSRRPDIWMQGLAYMNLPKARDAVAAIVQYVAGELDAGELKTKMLTVTVSMTEQEYTDLMEWAAARRNDTPGTLEYRLLYSATKFLKTEFKDYIKAPTSYFLQREYAKSAEQTIGGAAVVVADFLRTQVTLEEWRGSYS
jgi:hypothetical protein